MSTTEILEQINRLTLTDKLFVVEKAMKDLLKENIDMQMSMAAEALEEEYRTNKELTIFSNLDAEDFYEPK